MNQVTATGGRRRRRFRGGLAAARFALGEAHQRSATLHVVTAVPWPPRGRRRATPARVDSPAHLREAEQAVVDAIVEALGDTAAHVELETSVVEGHPVDVLRQASESAVLLVVGNRGVGGVAGVLLGSTASRVAAHAGCPVVVLQDDTNVLIGDRRSVVVGVEGRAGDEEVLAFAFDEAVARETDLLAVHAWEEVALDAPLRTPDWLTGPASSPTRIGSLLRRSRAGGTRTRISSSARPSSATGRPAR
jgi:nucleotide-binding universal stress UspA family protein